MVKSIQYMRPSNIRFTQDNISHEFGKGSDKSLEETFTELLYGIKNVNDIPHLAAVEEDGLLWVVSGNRRLYLYKRLERHGIIDTIPVLVIPKHAEKFVQMKTTLNDGTKVKIRSDRFYPNGQKLADRLDRIYRDWNRERNRRTTSTNFHSTNVNASIHQRNTSESVRPSNLDPNFVTMTKYPPQSISRTIKPSNVHLTSMNASINQEHACRTIQPCNPHPIKRERDASRSRSVSRPNFYSLSDPLPPTVPNCRSRSTSRPQSLRSTGSNPASGQSITSTTQEIDSIGKRKTPSINAKINNTKMQQNKNSRRSKQCCCTIL